MRTNSYAKFSSDWNFRLNMHFNPHALDPLLLSIKQTDKILTTEINKSNFIKLSDNSTAATVHLVITSILIIVIVALIWFIKFGQNTTERNPAEATEERKRQRPLLRKSNLKPTSNEA